MDVSQVNLRYFFKTLIFRSRARYNMSRFRGSMFRGDNHEMSLVTTLQTILYLYGRVSGQFEILFKTLIFRSRARSNMRRFRRSPFRGNNHEMSLVTTLQLFFIYIDGFQVNLSSFFKP